MKNFNKSKTNTCTVIDIHVLCYNQLIRHFINVILMSYVVYQRDMSTKYFTNVQDVPNKLTKEYIFQ